MANEVSINGQLHSWSSVRVNILGRSIIGLKGVDYSDSEEVKGVKGRGKMDVGIVQGNYQATGKLLFEMSEVETLNQSIPKGQRISDIPPFDVVVCYRTENVLNTHKLINCKFTGQGRSGKSGEVKEFEVELPLYIGEIDWNA